MPLQSTVLSDSHLGHNERDSPKRQCFFWRSALLSALYLIVMDSNSKLLCFAHSRQIQCTSLKCTKRPSIHGNGGVSTFIGHGFRSMSFSRKLSLHGLDNALTGIDRSTSTPPPSVQPLSPHSFAGRVERALLQRFQPNYTIQRVLDSWRLLDMNYEHREFVGMQQSPPVSDATNSRCYQYAPSYVPGLKAQTWWDNVQNYSWAKLLSKSYPAIRKEFLTAMSHPDKLSSVGNNIWAGALTADASSYGDGWSTLVLLNRGQWEETNARLFPVTSRAIKESGVPASEVFFASMKPRSKIQPHSDFTNFVLTLHLPLVIPENGKNQCRLSVGDETRQWVEGSLMLFDTSIYHDAVNDTDEMRYILMLRIWHPDLTVKEREALQFLYDCLEFPDIVSDDPGRVIVAEQRARRMKEFPLKNDRLGTGYAGFGSNDGKKDRNKRKGR